MIRLPIAIFSIDFIRFFQPGKISADSDISAKFIFFNGAIISAGNVGKGNYRWLFIDEIKVY